MGIRVGAGGRPPKIEPGDTASKTSSYRPPNSGVCVLFVDDAELPIDIVAVDGCLRIGVNAAHRPVVDLALADDDRSKSGAKR